MNELSPIETRGYCRTFQPPVNRQSIEGDVAGRFFKLFLRWLAHPDAHSASPAAAATSSSPTRQFATAAALQPSPHIAAACAHPTSPATHNELRRELR